MTSSSKKVRGLGLCSGGLDSILSALVLQKQGIEVEWITFETPFFSARNARRAAKNTGIPITVRNITTVYLDMLKNPPCGYGKHMNPCMDCHALMFRLAGDHMKTRGFDFLFSGEVVGQRPMSQNKQSMRYVEKHSGHDGYILRPLSAKNLPETLVEKEGLVDREQLLDLSGRTRKPQMALAEEFGVREYPAPAGGCLLTDKGFSDRLKDLFDHQDSYTEDELNLLKHGRHLRLDETTRIVVGRTQSDNENIKRHRNPDTDLLIKVKKFPGPVVVMPRGGLDTMVTLASAICAGYSKAPKNAPVEVGVDGPAGRYSVTVIPLSPADFKHFLI